MRVLHGSGELLVEMELHPAVEVRGYAVALRAELGIRLQPESVIFDEFPAGGCCEVLRPVLCERQLQIFDFQFDDTWIIHCRESVQLLLCLKVGGVFLDPDFRQMDVDGVQGE